MPLRDILDRLTAGEFTAVELAEHALARAGELHELNAFTLLDPDGALHAARASDERRRSGQPRGVLEGVPIAVKDLEDAAGLPTSMGSATRAGAPAAAADSPLVSRLRGVGAVVVGKTNTPELGWKAETDNPRFGPTRNPWDRTRTAGGSSGGSAAALAAGIVPVATGSDCGGSIRIPAAACGIPGFKPSPGLIPMTDTTPPHFHTAGVAGPMARTISDVSLLMTHVLGHALVSSLSSPDAPHRPRRPIRIRWSTDLGYAKVDSNIRAVCEGAVAHLDKVHFHVEQTDQIFGKDPIGTWLTIINAYNMRALRPYVDTPKWQDIDPGLAAMARTAMERTASDFVAAMDECWRLTRTLESALEGFDVLMCPTVGGRPPVIGEAAEIDGERVDNWVQLPYVFNLTESPAASVPVGLTSDGLPVSVQVVGRRNADADVLFIAGVIEDVIGSGVTQQR